MTFACVTGVVEGNLPESCETFEARYVPSAAQEARLNAALIRTGC